MERCRYTSNPEQIHKEKGRSPTGGNYYWTPSPEHAESRGSANLVSYSSDMGVRTWDPVCRYIGRISPSYPPYHPHLSCYRSGGSLVRRSWRRHLDRGLVRSPVLWASSSRCGVFVIRVFVILLAKIWQTIVTSKNCRRSRIVKLKINNF